MSVPDVAVAGPVLVIARSANLKTVVVTMAVLLAGFVSCVSGVDLTSAMLVMAPSVAGAMCAPMLKVALAPGASAPNVPVTTFGAVWLHPDDAPANVVPAGSVSVSVPPLEVEGPLFVMVTLPAGTTYAGASSGCSQTAP